MRNSGGGLPFRYGFLRGPVEVNLAVHIINPIERNEMMTTAGFRIILGQHYTVAAFFMVDRSDMFTSDPTTSMCSSMARMSSSFFCKNVCWDGGVPDADFG